ncbi:hypothetical protein Tco_0025164 [Tanacetum coccineum]
MDDPNITMEDYIQLMADKARGRDQTFNWETAMYGKVYCEDLDSFTDFETDFLAIVYNAASTSNQNVSSEPTEPVNNYIEINIESCLENIDVKPMDSVICISKDTTPVEFPYGVSLGLGYGVLTTCTDLAETMIWPPTPNPEWNKRQVVFDQPEHPWFNQMVFATKDPLTFNDLMATPIDVYMYMLNRLKIDNLTQDLLLGPAYDLLKGTCTSSIELEYKFQECFNALTDKLDWNNPEGDRYPFDMSKPLPLQGRPGHLTIAADYFFNNDLEYLKSSDPERTYTTSITKTKAARYEIVGIKDMVPMLWSTIKYAYDKDAVKGIKHWGERSKLWYRSQMYKFSKHNVYSTQKILSVKSVSVKKLHGYGHLEEVVVKRADQQLCNDIIDFIVALRMFTRSLIIKRQVVDLQVGVESYQKKLNITAPQQTFLEIEFKELYTPLYKPPGIIYKDLAKQKRVMRANDLYKFSDGTLKKVQDELHHRILDFYLGYNDEISRRK